MALFLARLAAFAQDVEADVHEIKSAARMEAASSGSSKCCESVLDSAKEDAEKVRDDLQRLNGSLTSPTLEELCKSFHTISMVNQRMLDQVECQLEADAGLEYVCFASKKEAENACAEPASVVLSAGAADGDGCQQQARAERSSLSLGTEMHGDRSSLGSVAGRVSLDSVCRSPAPRMLPSHLQVEPKTPDLEDFGISSIALDLINGTGEGEGVSGEAADDAENVSPNLRIPHAISALTKSPHEASWCKGQALVDKSPPPPVRPWTKSSGAEQEASERLPAPLPSWQAAAADAMQPQDAPLGEEGSEECKEGSRAAAGQLSLPEVSAEVFEAVPTFKRLNLTHGELNDTIAKLNDYLSQKRHEEHARSADTVSISEMQEHLGLGAKSKTLVLLLTHLSMLRTVKIDGNIVYAISSVPAA